LHPAIENRAVVALGVLLAGTAMLLSLRFGISSTSLCFFLIGVALCCSASGCFHILQSLFSLAACLAAIAGLALYKGSHFRVELGTAIAFLFASLVLALERLNVKRALLFQLLWLGLFVIVFERVLGLLYDMLFGIVLFDFNPEKTGLSPPSLSFWPWRFFCTSSMKR
jgi:hypothetical protein